MAQNREKLPSRAGRLANDQPAMWRAYQEYGKACAEAGPLDARAQRLVKLALAVAARTEGAVHSHVRRARAEGISADELRHVAYLAAPTIGFAAAVAALTWIDDLADKA